ncbi:hypothetical protein DNTS_029114 [Danionella cerebrum]|uniref:Craniofacial development protein 1 n=1 Tax=Danionella cerebrum TaxID=2873325 RepID=A0A553NJD7_9TELE|nr:hypothetical protein DNTS_029114 [Danionella translucida]
MNYSDYDSDGYSSKEDEDYVPSDDNLSEDDLNDCEKEDPLDADDPDECKSEPAKKKKKKTNADIHARKRKKGGLRLPGGEEGGSVDQPKEDNLPKEEIFVTKSTEEVESLQKKKADDLWASFLSDVGPRPAGTALSAGSHQSTSEAASQKSSKPSPDSPQQEEKPKDSSKITITKVFDFAGEEVRVTKEVDSRSREAKSFLKEEKAIEDQDDQCVSPQTQPSLPFSSGSSN